MVPTSEGAGYPTTTPSSVASYVENSQHGLAGSSVKHHAATRGSQPLSRPAVWGRAAQDYLVVLAAIRLDPTADPSMNCSSAVLTCCACVQGIPWEPPLISTS